MTIVEPALLTDLLAVVRQETGEPHVAFEGTPRALTGGFWARLVAFRLVGAPPPWDVPLVARVMPDADTAAKETAFQRAIAARGFPTPTVHAADGPGAGIDGQAYLVMDLAPGRPLLAGLDATSAIRRLPALVRRLPATLAGVLADLHRVEAADVVQALEAADVPRPTLASMLVAVRANAERLGRSDLVAVADWLEAHPVPDAPLVLCHGDLHPFNVLVSDDGAITVLDWSSAVLAPAAYDVAFTSLVLAEPPLIAPRPLRAVVRLAGRVLSRRFLRAYEEAAGAAVDRRALEWHRSLVALRALLEVASWSAAGTIGEHGGHPWVISSDALAARLVEQTGVRVAPR